MGEEIWRGKGSNFQTRKASNSKYRKKFKTNILEDNSKFENVLKYFLYCVLKVFFKTSNLENIKNM